MKILVFAVWSLALAGCVVPEQRFDASGIPDARADLDHWNIDLSGLVLDGFDPVSYFPEGGGTARLGDANRTVRYRGVTFFFASEANRKHFLADPEHFQPAYGAWSAWGMIIGEKREIDPEMFLIQDGRLLLFYNGFRGDSRARWLRAPNTSKPRADREWRQIVIPE